jgi:hypothetical protein
MSKALDFPSIYRRKYNDSGPPLDAYAIIGNPELLEASLDPNRHIRKKKLRDLDYRIYKVRLRMHNKKAKRDVPRLQAELNALQRAYDEVSRGNMGNVKKKVVRPRLCPICNGVVGKGYHICKPGPWRESKKAFAL